MKRMLLGVLWGLGASLPAQSVPAKADPFQSLLFLEGTWQARATRPDGVLVNGTYSFALDLKGTVLARHDLSQTSCKGPSGFDCEHGDLLYVYPEGGVLKAIYFDNEGHVINYGVKPTSANAVEFLSEGPGPQFRLAYELKGGVMSGRFQMRVPGQAAWRSYLEWSGGPVAATK